MLFAQRPTTIQNSKWRHQRCVRKPNFFITVISYTPNLLQTIETNFDINTTFIQLSFYIEMATHFKVNTKFIGYYIIPIGVTIILKLGVKIYIFLNFK